MASYCTDSDLNVLGVGVAVVEGIAPSYRASAIASASTLIDSYLRAHFKLPLTKVGADIVRAAAIIAAYDMLCARGLNPDSAADEALRQRYESTIRWLEKVAAGTVTPDVTGSGSGDMEGVPSTGGRAVSNASRGWQDLGDGYGGAFSGRR